MASDPYKNFSTTTTPQNQPLPGRTDMVANNAGGFVFQSDKFMALKRFLVIGSEGGTYYVGEQKLTRDNADNIKACLAEDGRLTVDLIRDVSLNGKAPRVNPQLFALAVACADSNPDTRTYALDAIGSVCRTGTHLFTFLTYVKQFRGMGRGLRRAIARWYEREPDRVAYQAVKYRNREGWSHRDALRISHPVPATDTHRQLYAWITQGTLPTNTEALGIIHGFAAAQNAKTVDAAVRVLSDFPGLPWETLPTDLLNSKQVWNTLLDNDMPIGALLRQLPRLTNLGIVKDRGIQIANRLTDEGRLRNARIHPMTVLNAFCTYRSGRGMRTYWTPDRKIVDALDSAFYLAFPNVEPANKRTLIALDVSGSMTQGIANMGYNCREASAAMALITAATEPEWDVVAFTSGGWDPNDGITHLSSFSPRQRMDDVIRTIQGLRFGGTDCALPLLWAAEHRHEYDTVAIYTDSETWAGNIHVTEALKRYRDKMGIPAKVAVVGMTATNFTLADPQDRGMLDVAGFSSDTPNVIAGFSRGDF